MMILPGPTKGAGVVPNPDTLLDSLERFAAALTSGYGIGDVLHNLTEEMAEVLNLTGAGVTLVHDGQQRFVTAAVEAIATLERVQETLAKGPVHRRCRIGRPSGGAGHRRRRRQRTLAGLRHRGQDRGNPGRRRHPDARRRRSDRGGQPV